MRGGCVGGICHCSYWSTGRLGLVSRLPRGVDGQLQGEPDMGMHRTPLQTNTGVLYGLGKHCVRRGKISRLSGCVHVRTFAVGRGKGFFLALGEPCGEAFPSGLCSTGTEGGQ